MGRIREVSRLPQLSFGIEGGGQWEVGKETKERERTISLLRCLPAEGIGPVSRSYEKYSGGREAYGCSTSRLINCFTRHDC